MNKLNHKYEDRIKDFVFTVINYIYFIFLLLVKYIFIIQMLKSPIKITELPKKIENVRQKQFDDESEKILAGKGMVFNQFKSDLTRVKEMQSIQTTQMKNQQRSLSNLNLSTTQMSVNKSMNESFDASNPNEKSTRFLQNYKLVQPAMRYKARTDLERLYDTINAGKNSYGNINKNFLTKNLLNLDPDLKKKYQLEQLKKAEEFDDDLNQPIIQVKLEKGHVDNSFAKLFMKDLHTKTHFKGASVFALRGEKYFAKDKPQYKLRENLDNSIINLDDSEANPDFLFRNKIAKPSMNKAKVMITQ